MDPGAGRDLLRGEADHGLAYCARAAGSRYVLALPLLVPGVIANHAQDAAPAYHLAVVANGLYARPHPQSFPPGFAFSGREGARCTSPRCPREALLGPLSIRPP